MITYIILIFNHSSELCDKSHEYEHSNYMNIQKFHIIK